MKTFNTKQTEKEKRIATLKANAAKITANLAARAKAHKEANS